MLKIILSIAGVVLIGLGVFGGPLLENITGQFSNQSEQMAEVEIPSSTDATVSTNATVTEDASVKVASAVATDDATETAIQTVSADAVPDTNTAGTPANTPASTPVTSASVTTSDASVSAETEGSEMIAVKSTDEVAEPMAPAQAAGDLMAMTEQAKSSSRNEQVKLAETILASAKQPVAPEPVEKTTEVESVVKAATGEPSNEVLVVVKDKVNLRDGPSIDHPIVLQLQQGQELMEFKREGNWVHVGAYGTSGKIGWVHQRLVSVPN